MGDTLKTIPQLQAVWNTRLSVNTTPRAAAATYAPLSAGIENIEEALNEQTKQYFFLGSEGFACNEVNALAPTFTLQGRRVYGDAAQDYIDSLKYQLAEARKTSIRLDVTQPSGATVSLTCPVTITAVTTLGGAASDNSSFSVTFALNGKPTLTTA